MRKYCGNNQITNEHTIEEDVQGTVITGTETDESGKQSSQSKHKEKI